MTPDEVVFDDRELHQPEDEPQRKPKLRRFKADVRYRLVFETMDDVVPMHTPCRVSECAGTATYGKPYCIEHLDRLPYIKAMKAELAVDPEKQELLDMLD